MWKTLTKDRNKKFILAYYALALIFVTIGLFQKNPQWYIVAIVLIVLASYRKYWLMKKLKD